MAREKQIANGTEYVTSQCDHGGHADGEFCDYCLVAMDDHNTVKHAFTHDLDGEKYTCNQCC